MINEIIKSKQLGKLYNLTTLHAQELGIRKDSGDVYSMCKDILANPNKYKQLTSNLEKYENKKD